MKTWFSADWHLEHTNVIKYDNRPFKSIQEMNDTIMDNFLATVQKGDNFYFLGDFCFAAPNIAEEYLREMRTVGANMFFIKGNHDKQDMIKLYGRFGVYLGEQKKIRVGEQEIILNHYRMDVWDKSHHGSWHLHGHSHHSLPIRENARCMDVGVNGGAFDYKPLEFSYIAKVMSFKKWKPIDHHGSHTLHNGSQIEYDGTSK